MGNQPARHRPIDELIPDQATPCRSLQRESIAQEARAQVEAGHWQQPGTDSNRRHEPTYSGGVVDVGDRRWYAQEVAERRPSVTDIEDEQLRGRHFGSDGGESRGGHGIHR
jgi:hypothetical protein